MASKSRSLAALMTVFLMAPAVAAAPSQSDTPATMRSILGALITLLPRSLDAETFADPLNEAIILEALEVLRENAAALEQHGLGLDRSYDRVRQGLSDDATEALETFRAHEYHAARFVVRNLTENCFACHTRRPLAGADELGDRLAAFDVTALPRGERLELLVALQRFTDALEFAEAMLEDPTQSPAEIDAAGIFESYLKVSLRVQRDLERPRAAFTRLLERKDLPLYLDLQAMEWVIALDELAAAERSTDLLTQGRELLDEARRRSLYFRDRRGLVHAIMASGLLHQYVQSAPQDDADVAEAYYLLGLAEASISRTIWVPETEFFLETAIRTAPQTEAARNAYAFLEQYVIANYTGSAGLNVPEGVGRRLMLLRALIDE